MHLGDQRFKAQKHSRTSNHHWKQSHSNLKRNRNAHGPWDYIFRVAPAKPALTPAKNELKLVFRNYLLEATMHVTAFQNAARFRNTYASGPINTLVEIGSQIVAGQQSLRAIFENTANYVGVDFQDAPGVDIIISDPYQFPLADSSANVVISSSCLEHSEFFWLAFLEMCRICRGPGLIYLNMPSDGPVHRYPVDCWRFYPDSGKALEKWAKRNGYVITLLESYISDKGKEPFSDYVCVFCKGADSAKFFPNRITDSFKEPLHIYREK